MAWAGGVPARGEGEDGGDDVATTGASKWCMAAYPSLVSASCTFTWQREVIDGSEQWTGLWMTCVRDGDIDRATTTYGTGFSTESALDSAHNAAGNYVHNLGGKSGLDVAREIKGVA